MNDKIKKISLCGVLAAGAMILSYVESMLPPISAALPGVRVGLANILIIFALFRLELSSAAAVSAVRLTLSAILFGSAVTFIYSLFGAILSLTVMVLAKKTGKLTMTGVSILGGVSHNAGQIIAAILLTNTSAILLYLPVLVISGTVSGIFIGLCAVFVLKTLRNVKI